MTISLKKSRTALLLIASVFALGATGCGPSQEEYDAQLAKYEKLNAEHTAEKSAHAATAKELEEGKKKVKALTDELKKMGVNIDVLSSNLQQVGTEKENLTKSMEELQAALEEYKQRAAQLEQIKARFDQLRAKLNKLTEQGLKVEIRHNRMVIRLPGDVLYSSGSDKLRDEGRAVVGAVAEVIRNDEQLKKRYFQVAGHTDDRPLKGGRFGDNWGLSAMRARTVLAYLIETKDGGGLDPKLLHAAGYGDIDPVATNDTPEGRGLNRRVELVLLPDVEEMLNLKSL